MMSTIEEITKTMLVLKTGDHQEFTLEKSAAEQSITIKNMIEDLDDKTDSTMFIPLPKIDSKTLTKVIDYLKIHDNAATSTTTGEELEKLDNALVDGVPMEEICYVTQAANYFNISGLLEISCQIVVDHIKKKSHVYVRKLFNVESDHHTKEEEEALIQENYWAYEDVDSDHDTKIELSSFVNLDDLDAYAKEL